MHCSNEVGNETFTCDKLKKKSMKICLLKSSIDIGEEDKTPSKSNIEKIRKMYIQEWTLTH